MPILLLYNALVIVVYKTLHIAQAFMNTSVEILYTVCLIYHAEPTEIPI